jgi:hypothetical protein
LSWVWVIASGAPLRSLPGAGRTRNHGIAIGPNFLHDAPSNRRARPGAALASQDAASAPVIDGRGRSAAAPFGALWRAGMRNRGKVWGD